MCASFSLRTYRRLQHRPHQLPSISHVPRSQRNAPRTRRASCVSSSSSTSEASPTQPSYPPWRPTYPSEQPPPIQHVTVTMEFLGYTHFKPAKRQFEKVTAPYGQLRYNNPGVGSANMEDLSYYLQCCARYPRFASVSGRGLRPFSPRRCSRSCTTSRSAPPDIVQRPRISGMATHCWIVPRCAFGYSCAEIFYPIFSFRLGASLSIRCHLSTALLVISLLAFTAAASGETSAYGMASIVAFGFSGAHYPGGTSPSNPTLSVLAGAPSTPFQAPAVSKAGIDGRATLSPGYNGGSAYTAALRASLVPNRNRLRPYFQVGGGVASTQSSETICNGFSCSPRTDRVTNGVLHLDFGLDIRVSDQLDVRAFDWGADVGAAGNADHAAVGSSSMPAWFIVSDRGAERTADSESLTAGGRLIWDTQAASHETHPLHQVHLATSPRAIDLEDLMEALSDFFLDSGFRGSLVAVSQNAARLHGRSARGHPPGPRLRRTPRRRRAGKVRKSFPTKASEELVEKIIQRMKDAGLPQRRSRPETPKARANRATATREHALRGHRQGHGLPRLQGPPRSPRPARQILLGRHDTLYEAAGVETNGSLQALRVRRLPQPRHRRHAQLRLRARGPLRWLRTYSTSSTPDLQVQQADYQSSCATVVLLDCSHSMILYGEDRFTPAKASPWRSRTSSAPSIPATAPRSSSSTTPPKRSRSRKLPRVKVGPHYTNTREGLRVAQRVLAPPKRT